MNDPNQLPNEPNEPRDLDESWQKLEAELRQLRPRSPNPDLLERIAAALQESRHSGDAISPLLQPSEAGSSQQSEISQQSEPGLPALAGQSAPQETGVPTPPAISPAASPLTSPEPTEEIRPREGRPVLGSHWPTISPSKLLGDAQPIRPERKPQSQRFWKSFGPVGWTALAAVCLVGLAGMGFLLAWIKTPGPGQVPPVVQKPSQGGALVSGFLAAGYRVHPWGDARYQIVGPSRVRLEQGTVGVSAPAGQGPESFLVETPAGLVRIVWPGQARGQPAIQGLPSPSQKTTESSSKPGQTAGGALPRPSPYGLSGSSTETAASAMRPSASRPPSEPTPNISLSGLSQSGAGPAPVEFIVEVFPVASEWSESSSFSKESLEMNAGQTSVKWWTYVWVLAGMVELVNPWGMVTGRPGELLAAQTESAPQKQVEKLAGQFGKYYQPVSVQTKPSVPAYPLPVDISKVANAEQALKKLRLSPEAVDRLRQNGFVVVPMEALPGVVPPGLGPNDIVKPYGVLKRLEIPIFITTDTLLHLYRVQFDQSLMDIEQREFYPDMVVLCTMLVDRYESAYGKAKDPLEKQALAKGWVWAAVGRKCLEPDWQPAGPIARSVSEVMEKIEKHEGFWPPQEAAYQAWPVFRYSEDFSQYVPRGHYTRSEELKRYFLAMMWFGRMTFLLKGEEPFGPQDQPALVPPTEAQAQTLAAAYAVKFLQEKWPDGRTGRKVWQRIYTVTAFYVGFSDDLGVAEYEAALRKVLGPKMDVAQLTEQTTFQKLQVELAKLGGPSIYGGTGNVITYVGAEPQRLVAALDKTTGFRLMGQRFVPDSYVMGRLVFPTVGPPQGGQQGMFTYVQAQIGPIRGFPRGLDVAAWLGSRRARHWLQQLGDDQYGTETDLRKGKNLRYDVVLEDLIRQFESLSAADWNRNAYWSWLYALKALLEPYGKGYPTFMTTEAWQDKSMTTALASWAQLRHDTILYAKQSYTMARGSAWMPKPVEGYVEPVPEFYARLLTTTRLTLAGLKVLDALQPQAAERLEKLASLLEKLLAISQKELAHQELSQEEYDFIRNVSQQLQRIEVQDPELVKLYQQAQAQRDPKQLQKIMTEIELRSGRSPMETTLIADVHTDANSQEVLQEGTGYVDLVVVCYLQPTGQGDGQLVLGAGPVLSYYEFRHPMADRLTDEQWIEHLRKGKAPKMPAWTETYRVEKLAPPPAPPMPIQKPPVRPTR